MRIAIISDIHGNLEALKSVFASIDESNIDKTICLGDMINYGPQSEEVVAEIIRRGISSVMGNHELAVVVNNASDFNSNAKTSLKITERQLSQQTLDFIETLPDFIELEDLLFVHGCPPDSITEYAFLCNDTELQTAFKSVKRIAFVGHSHYLDVFSSDKFNETYRNLLTEGFFQLTPGMKYIFSIGSVGQPRDKDKRAKYAIFDTATDTLIMKFIKYDVMKTYNLIFEKGYPIVNATRLLD